MAITVAVAVAVAMAVAVAVVMAVVMAVAERRAGGRGDRVAAEVVATVEACPPKRLFYRTLSAPMLFLFLLRFSR